MRWLCGSTNPQEAHAKKHTLSTINDFWQEFSGKVADINEHIHGHSKWDMPSWMSTSLNRIAPNIEWEFGPAINTAGHRLMITSASDRHNHPLIQAILNHAPTLPGWEFYPYRLPESFETALNVIQARGGADPRDLKFRAHLNKYRGIELTFAAPFDTELVQTTAALAAISILGEELLNKWIGQGGIIVEASGPFEMFRRFFRRHDDGKTYRPLSDLKRTVDTLVSSVKDQLPAKPLFEIDRLPAKINADGHQVVGQLFKIDRKLPPMNDYPFWVDLYVGQSSYPEIFEAGYLSANFCSARFSKSGELFGCLKIDGRSGLEVFKDRGEIEDAIDDALRPNRAGRTIGGGTGHVYSYITLALADLPKSIDLLRKVLQEGKIPKRTWLLFFDLEYWDEWVGIWDDTPPPPTVD
jgi:hypothetical protein